jgi:hypothetical protein
VLAFSLSGLQPGQAETVTGTGFAVTFDGVVITNHHVISECDSAIRARIEGSPEYYYVATVAARDASRDLAALKLQRRVGQGAQGPIRAIPRAIFRKGPAVQQGEKAITYGFPLRGLLATSGNLTLGYVSALSGLGDDRNYIQITTPVQQGNSGGPLYDGSGHVIGVVVAKLNALRVMLATGDVPQNVNFAVELSAVRRFLQQNRLQVAEEESINELPVPEIAQKSKLSTYAIECSTKEYFLVQIDSQKTETDARAASNALRLRFANELRAYEPIIRRADLGQKGIFYRTIIGPFDQVEAAEALCERLKIAGGQCIVQRGGR